MSPLLLTLTLTLSGLAATPASAVPVAALPTPAPVSGPAAVVPATPLIGYLTAGDLANRCGGTSGADASYCFAFIAGVHDTIQAYEKWLGTREFCPHAATAQADLRRAFLAYLNAYPSNRAGVAASVVVVALKQSFPC